MSFRSEAAQALNLIVELDDERQRDYRMLGPDQAATYAKDLFDAWELVSPNMIEFTHHTRVCAAQEAGR